jgi:acyl dehydratase
MDGDGQLYLDDFALGDRFRSPGHTLGEVHFLLFSGLTGDNHPIHYDEDYARQIPLRRRGDVPHEALLLDGAVSRRFDGWVSANVAWAVVAEPPHRWRPTLRLPSCAGEPCLATP